MIYVTKDFTEKVTYDLTLKDQIKGHEIPDKAQILERTKV